MQCWNALNGGFVPEKALAWQLWETGQESAQSSTNPFSNTCLDFGNGAICDFHEWGLPLWPSVSLFGLMFKTEHLDSASLLCAPVVASRQKWDD